MKSDSDPTTEGLLRPSRLQLKFDRKEKNNGLQSRIAVDLHVEPIELTVGYREIEFFNKYYQTITKFSDEVFG